MGMSDARISIQEPVFAERWFSGTYIVSGIFFLDGSNLTVANIQDDVGRLYREIKEQKKAWWPRGLAGFYVIPIYRAPAFDTEILSRVRKRLPFRWAIWPEPILYITSHNSFMSREDYEANGSSFYAFLSQLLTDGLNRTAAHFDYDIMPSRAVVRPKNA
jgi:hypothetical protein